MQSSIVLCTILIYAVDVHVDEDVDEDVDEHVHVGIHVHTNCTHHVQLTVSASARSRISRLHFIRNLDPIRSTEWRVETHCHFILCNKLDKFLVFLLGPSHGCIFNRVRFRFGFWLARPRFCCFRFQGRRRRKVMEIRIWVFVVFVLGGGHIDCCYCLLRYTVRILNMVWVMIDQCLKIRHVTQEWSSVDVSAIMQCDVMPILARCPFAKIISLPFTTVHNEATRIWLTSVQYGTVMDGWKDLQRYWYVSRTMQCRKQ